MRSWLALACMLVACGTSDGPPPDPCASTGKMMPGGSVEVGLGSISDPSSFTSVTENENVTLQLGLQGLWMFVVTARATDMDLGSGAHQGVVTLTILDAQDNQLSIVTGCRVGDFDPDATGDAQLAEPYTLPFDPSVEPMPDGATVKLHLDLRDHDGHEATDERTVIAHLPSN